MAENTIKEMKKMTSASRHMHIYRARKWRNIRSNGWANDVLSQSGVVI